jgi:hypothetical protein
LFACLSRFQQSCCTFLKIRDPPGCMVRMFLRQSVVAVIARFGASAKLAVGKRDFLVDLALW